MKQERANMAPDRAPSFWHWFTHETSLGTAIAFVVSYVGARLLTEIWSLPKNYVSKDDFEKRMDKMEENIKDEVKEFGEAVKGLHNAGVLREGKMERRVKDVHERIDKIIVDELSQGPKKRGCT